MREGKILQTEIRQQVLHASWGHVPAWGCAPACCKQSSHPSYLQVKAECARLSHAITTVTRERDLAVKDRHQLQAKLESLEEVLKVGGRPVPLPRGRVGGGLRLQEQEGGTALFQAAIQIQYFWAISTLFMV